MFRASSVFVLMLALPSFGAEVQEVRARQFLDAVKSRDQKTLTAISRPYIYVARVTDEEHIVIAREHAQILDGFERHLRDVSIVLDDYSSDNDFVMSCATIRQGRKTFRWLVSFEFYEDQVKNVALQNAESICRND